MPLGGAFQNALQRWISYGRFEIDVGVGAVGAVAVEGHRLGVEGAVDAGVVALDRRVPRRGVGAEPGLVGGVGRARRARQVVQVVARLERDRLGVRERRVRVLWRVARAARRSPASGVPSTIRSLGLGLDGGPPGTGPGRRARRRRQSFDSTRQPGASASFVPRRERSWTGPGSGPCTRRSRSCRRGRQVDFRPKPRGRRGCAGSPRPGVRPLEGGPGRRRARRRGARRKGGLRRASASASAHVEVLGGAVANVTRTSTSRSWSATTGSSRCGACSSTRASSPACRSAEPYEGGGLTGNTPADLQSVTARVGGEWGLRS